MSDLIKVNTDIVERDDAAIVPVYNKPLEINADSPDIDFKGLLNKICQYVNMADAVENIEKATEYVVQIPLQHQDSFKEGKSWIMESSKTGKMWPMLVTKGESGKQEIVTPLAIVARDSVDEESFEDIATAQNNLYLQQQINELSDLVKETLDVVKKIEHGQLDDRVGKLNAGRQGVMLALNQKDVASRPVALQMAISQINEAQQQILETLKRRVNEFEALPKTVVMQFLKEVAKNGYLDGKDDEFNEIRHYFELYLQSTQMLAAAYAVMGDIGNVQLVFDNAVGALQSLDYSKLDTIAYSHKGVEIQKPYELMPKAMLLEKEMWQLAAQKHDCLTVKVSGQMLLEAYEDGKE